MNCHAQKLLYIRDYYTRVFCVFKDIVSRDFEWLQIILMNTVDHVSLMFRCRFIFFKFTFSYCFLSFKFSAG